RGKALFRSIFIIPYAIPAFISALVWRGLLNDRYGQVNGLLNSLGFGDVPWLIDGTWAKVAVLMVNTWLGFPYMFLITTGALQAIPAELKEAARVDGAGPFRVFRTVTVPLLLVTTAPLLIGSFAFNFNNFVLIYLLTQGGPPVAGAGVPFGETDILISFTFDLAVRSGRGADFGLASAIVVIIFLLVAAMSAFSFRFTRRLEEIYGNA
ncbi:MAG: ABC transporter permease subunit, partial [Acidimicrobiia bacterium]|nr:ABC transporter permease subunit [Acidimicrobiia bacterium]